jgi:CubicO group peptidase (beta-lactamase class C family)
MARAAAAIVAGGGAVETRPEFQQTGRLTPSTAEKTIGYFRDKPLDFAPGERMSYSNAGYVLLGYLVERVSGKRYADYVSDNVFQILRARCFSLRRGTTRRGGWRG